MGEVKRSVIKFLVPADISAIGRNDLLGRFVIPMYINPESVDIQESKIMRPELTKGGYVVEYWGEELATMQCNGKTGSGGIEAIHILRSVYRNEQVAFKRLLLGRLNEPIDEAIKSSGVVQNIKTLIEDVSSDINDLFSANGLSSFVDTLVSSTVIMSDSDIQKTELIPSLASFALTVQMYFQGEKYTGYFDSFSYSENANTPGLFNYSFSFKILKRSGKRNNFMPWHKNPYDSSGNPRQSSTSRESSPTDNLSFPYNNSTQNSIMSSTISTKFQTTQEQTNVPVNNIGTSRLNKIKGS